MAALADIWKVQVQYRPLADSELAAVTDLLNYASAKLRKRVPSIDARITAGTLDPELAAGAVANAVVRVLRNRDTAVRESLSSFDGDSPPGAAEWTSTIGFLQGEIEDVSPPQVALVGTFLLGEPVEWWYSDEEDPEDDA